MVIRSKSKLIAVFAIGMVAAVTTAAVAQSAAPSLPSPEPVYQTAPAAPAVVVAPVVPQSPAQDAGALEAIEQSATASPVVAPAVIVAPVASGPDGTLSSSAAGPAPYVVPPSGPGIFQGSEQTMREILFLETEVAINGKRKERIESVAALKAAEKELTDQLSGKSQGDEKKTAAAGADGTATPVSPSVAPIVVAPKPEPYVNSVYGYGGDMYAEIVLGSSKVLATKGTVLNDGSRVVAVSNNGVTLSKGGRTKKISIRGAAGY